MSDDPSLIALSTLGDVKLNPRYAIQAIKCARCLEESGWIFCQQRAVDMGGFVTVHDRTELAITELKRHGFVPESLLGEWLWRWRIKPFISALIKQRLLIDD